EPLARLEGRLECLPPGATCVRAVGRCGAERRLCLAETVLLAVALDPPGRLLPHLPLFRVRRSLAEDARDVVGRPLDRLLDRVLPQALFAPRVLLLGPPGLRGSRPFLFAPPRGASGPLLDPPALPAQLLLAPLPACPLLLGPRDAGARLRLPLAPP